MQNKVFDETGRALCRFDPDTFEVLEYFVDASRVVKMSIGRVLSPYRKKEKFLDYDPSSVPEPVKKEDKPDPSYIAPKKVEKISAKDMMPPWEAFPDCPQRGRLGDKTEEIVRWVYEYQPEYYKLYYGHRKTIIDQEKQDLKKKFLTMGEEYFKRGMKITDVPKHFTPEQKEFFKAGYKKYMNQELGANA